MIKQRYYSLDVFRGATVALMIMVNNPGTWAHMFTPLKHAAWHGCSPTDLVFPFFLFAVGNAMSFVIPRLQEAGPAVFWKKVLKRTVLIFAIGLFINWWPFVKWEGAELVFKHWVDPLDPSRGIRILGVLQRIAIAYCFASILAYYFKEKAIITISTIILLLYWAICALAGGADPYSLEGWFGTKYDIAILGLPHVYKGEGVPFDPEGLMSTLPAVVQVAFGYLVGVFIKKQGQSDWLWPKVPASNEPHFKLLAGMFVTGFILLVLAWVWALGFPINKKIWTSSYVLYTTGLAIMTIGGMIWFIEVQGVKNKLTQFFDVFGKNPLFIFVLSGILPRLLGLFRIPDGTKDDGTARYIDAFGWFYKYVCAKIPGIPEIGSFVYSLCFLVLMWVICYALDKKKIYVKV
ncbi:heparan-alpha-glucosaminide N-acetyltransferase domain-containing protein [Sphingobacterium thalpophilum]|uniref:Heparan-alpha-glucosaminide N-acetyltransferase domain-containing protein n=1 Tax=Sphingobacterium thalpophilum TaxID=259 RepID=A0ABV4H9L2_9SPHI|nr:heparan-alpha-glucosaminide N-acetyltransferase domain-containing protein [Sphingobacterium thalpophilum]